MKKFAPFLYLFLIMPMVVSAASIYDIGSGAQNLFLKFSERAAGTETMLNPPIICGIPPARPLYLGVRGEDVRRLQGFLYEGGYLNVQATGYFGLATRKALAEYQGEVGIARAGVLGPKTREHFRNWCSNPKVRFAAYPEAGSAPLTVTFKSFVSIANPNFVADAGSYKVVFGDGTEQNLYCTLPAQAGGNETWCQGPHIAQHTYTSEGTYVANLVHFGFFGRMEDSVNGIIVGRKIIRVGNFACTMEYTPVCAEPPGCAPQPYGTELCAKPEPKTYSNRCVALGAGAAILYEGECRIPPGKNQPPVISGIFGPTVLSMKETGIWTISASDPENGQLSYTISWGDEWVGAVPMARSYAPEYSAEQKTTFTHSYSNPGTYTVRVSVRDSGGLTAEASATVSITRNTCREEYSPVCGRPPGCSNHCPPGAYCPMICRLYDPVTYQNKCALESAGAQYLYDGKCR